MPLNETQKLFFLQRVFEEKSALFGQFSGVGEKGISSKGKKEIWQKISNELIAMGASQKDCMVDNLRHNTWQNLKKRLRKKLTS